MSAAYAHVSYYTAYLKTYYPVEFMAALLTSHIGNSDKVAEYITEVEQLGIEVLPPDVNYSRFGFSVEEDKIRFGLQGIKHVGHKAIEEIISAREEKGFESLTDFCQRIDLRSVNQRVVESLIKAGAFDSVGYYRSQLLEVLPKVFKQAQKVQKEQSNGQTSFSDLFADDNQFVASKVEIPEIEEFTEEKLLALEKEMLGLYLSGNPLEQILPRIKQQRNKKIVDLDSEQEKVIIGGLIVSKREVITKNKREMAFLTLEDETEEIDVIVFPDIYKESQELIAEDKGVLIKGQLNDERKIVAKEITDITVDKGSEQIVHLQLKEPTEDKLSDLKEVLTAYSGNRIVYLHLVIDKQRVSIKLDNQYQLQASSQLSHELDKLGAKHLF
ncbi:hypothetical protein JCM16358_11930 [Halanaerocella petrolearia]